MNSAPTKSSPLISIVVTALMLFSMFFGAGNLIFPAMLGAEAGENFTPAITGFLVTGVLMPILAVIALAVTGRDLQDLAARGGKIFALVFPPLVYLSIGALYALPRTGTVSYAMAVDPYLSVDGMVPTLIFSAVFFGISYLLAMNPTGIVDTLGKYLTPALVILLGVLVVMSFITLRTPSAAPTEDYATGAFATGFVNGYMTMDSLAALAFGIIVIASLREKGVTGRSEMLRSVALAGGIAGVLLGAVYLGLGYIGEHIADGQGYKDGAALLTDAAAQTMGGPGAVVFGLIVLLACLTTSVGLIGATSSFFNKLVPSVSYRTWAIIFTLIAFALASFGLEGLMSFAIPIITTLYPPALTLVVLTLIEAALRAPWMNLTHRFALLVSVIWALLMTLNSQGLGSNVIEPLIGWAPAHAYDLGWFVPTLVAALIGAAIDLVQHRRASAR